MGLSKPASLSRSTDVYKCPVCRDAGFVHPRGEHGQVCYDSVVPCQCQTERIDLERKAYLLHFCRLPIETQNQTFETFKAYTPDLKEALATAKEVADPDGKLRWLTIMAKVDRGKSHLAVAICRAWLKRGIPARYVFVPDLLDELRASYQTQEDHSFLSTMHLYKTVPMLVMDDLGSEKTSEWVTEKLTAIINTRAENGLHLVLTTNKPLNALPGDVENRIGSRLRRYHAGRVIAIEDAGEYSFKSSSG